MVGKRYTIKGDHRTGTKTLNGEVDLYRYPIIDSSDKRGGRSILRTHSGLRIIEVIKYPTGGRLINVESISPTFN